MRVEDGSRLIDWWLRGLGGAISQLRRLVAEGVPHEEKNVDASRWCLAELERLDMEMRGFRAPENPYPYPWRPRRGQTS